MLNRSYYYAKMRLYIVICTNLCPFKQNFYIIEKI